MPSKISGPKKIDGYDEWELEGCLRSLIEAEKIQKDPKKLKAILKIAKKKMGDLKVEINTIEDLKAHRSSMSEKMKEEEYG